MDKPIRIRAADGRIVDLAVERLNLLDIQRIHRPYDPPLQRDPKHDAFDAAMHKQATTSLAILDALVAALSVPKYTDDQGMDAEMEAHNSTLDAVREAARVVEE